MGELGTFSDGEARLVALEREKYRPIAEAVGLIAIEWNSIHNGLGHIFAHIAQCSEDDAYKKWNKERFDGQKRKLLKEETLEFYKDRKERENINRLLDKISKVGSNRNSSIHCPFTLFIEDDQLKVLPDDTTEDPHAVKLRDVDIPSELQARWDELRFLGSVTFYILDCLRDPEGHTPFPSEFAPDFAPYGDDFGFGESSP